jgi:hypothetical protein
VGQTLLAFCGLAQLLIYPVVDEENRKAAGCDCKAAPSRSHFHITHHKKFRKILFA